MKDGSGPPWLLLSAVLNVFLIGALVGGGITWWRSSVEPQATSVQRRLAGEQLEPGKRAAFRQALRQARREARPLIHESRTAKRQVAGLLQAPSLDQAALAAALARTRRADYAVREREEAHAVDFIATLSVDDRSKLSRGLTQRMGRHRSE